MQSRVTFPGGKKVHAEFDNGMVVETDQPVQYGGDNTAPSPYWLFISSIGTCAGSYVLSFCNERGIPTEGININQRLEFDTTPFGTSKLARIVLDINVPGGFPEKYHKALVKVADQCAVKKTIMDPPEFKVQTVVN